MNTGRTSPLGSAGLTSSQSDSWTGLSVPVGKGAVGSSTLRNNMLSFEAGQEVER